jgi:hypothetical protein
MKTNPDDPEISPFLQEWALRDNPGRMFAAALARLIEAYELSPDRTRHALSWEHLSPNIISERDESSAQKSSDSAKRVIQTSMLHVGEAPLSEYSQLLDDWNLISDSGEEDSFKLDEYMGRHHINWEVTGEGLTPTEKRRLQGWSIEDLELLRTRDPELLSEYRQELEKEAVKHAEKGQDYNETEENRKIWIEARLADVDSAIESKILRARANDLEAQLSRWKQIEHMRSHSEVWGRLRIWAETPEDARPEKPAWDERRFPDSLTPEMRSLYETTEQKKNQVWRTLSREIVDEYEALVGQLVTLSKELPTTPVIAREMARREKERAEGYRGGPRVPIPTDYGWYEYCGLDMDDMANLNWEIEDEVRKNGNLWIHWAKEMVGMLPAITKRAVIFGKHPVSDISNDSFPESLTILFEQAHMSYLFNQDVPCTLVCGSLLEHAFEIKFPVLFEEWDSAFKSAKKQGKKPEALAFWQKLDIVVSKFSFCAPARQRADAVWSARTEAMHHPDRYLAQARYRAIDALRDTREALRILFPLVIE